MAVFGSGSVGTAVALKEVTPKPGGGKMDALAAKKVVAARAVDDDFAWARSKARNATIISFFRGRNDDLLSFEEVRKALQPTGESYVGCRSIPVKRVVGSDGRSRDFNRSFMPRGDFMRERWVRVDRAYDECKILRPVKVLEIGGVYFVRDGNHLVSVARLHDVGYIDAEVTRLKGDVPLEPGMPMADIEERLRAAKEPKTAA